MSTYCTHSDISAFLGCDSFTTDKGDTVNDLIIMNEDEIDRRIMHSFREVTVSDETHNVDTKFRWRFGRVVYLNNRKIKDGSVTVKVWNGCLTKDTIVYTDRGAKRLIDLKEGEDVYCFDLKKKKLEKTKVKNIIENGVKEVFLLKTQTKEIEATANHPFLVMTKTEKERRRDKKGKFIEEKDGQYGFLWKPLSDLKEGDVLFTLENSIDEGKTHWIGFKKSKLKGNENVMKIPEFTSKKLMTILGFYIGDGSKSRGSIYLHEFEERRQEKYIGLVKEVFGIKTKKDKHNGLYINSRRLRKLFEHLGVTGLALTKSIPLWIFSLPHSQIEGFLEGYVDADGWRKNDREWSLGSANLNLLKECKKLCNIIGWRTGEVGKVEARDNRYSDKPMYHMGIYPQTKRFNVRGVNVKNKIEDIKFSELMKENIRLEKITEIVPFSKEETYDLETENENHNFVANGFIVHNSSWENWGSEGSDFTVNNNEGIVYIRGFWYWTEREMIMQVSYTFGETSVPKDIKKACVLLTAIDLVSNENFWFNLPEGGNALALREKITIWQDKADKILENRQEVKILLW